MSNLKIGKNVYVAESAVIMGDVSLHENASVWPNSTIRADMGPIIVGENSNIQDNCVLHVSSGGALKIGKNVTVGHSAILHGCDIEDECLIGMGTIVLDGAHIKKNCLIGAGSLVTQNMTIEEGSLVFGSPAKFIRKLTDKEIEGIRESAYEYMELAKMQINRD